MLGLALAGAALVLDGRRLAGAAAFCGCLAFKQMGLYYATVFFAFLLGETLARFRRWDQRCVFCGRGPARAAADAAMRPVLV
jgi:hypothetical protein